MALEHISESLKRHNPKRKFANSTTPTLKNDRVSCTIYIQLEEFADPERYPDGIAWRSGILDDHQNEIDGEGDIATYEEAKTLALNTLERLLNQNK